MSEKKEGKIKALKLLLQVFAWIFAVILTFIWYDYKLVIIMGLFVWANSAMFIETQIAPLQKMVQLILKSIGNDEGKGNQI